MLASAMVFVIVAGEIDLSVGSLLGLLGGIAAVLDVTYAWPLWVLTITLVIAIGLFFGVMVGWLTAYLGIPSFIVTLGGQLAFRGMVLTTGGITIAPVHEDLKFIGQGYLPEWLGNAGGIVLFAVLVFLAFRTRSNRQKHNLSVSALAGRSRSPAVRRHRDPRLRADAQ